MEGRERLNGFRHPSPSSFFLPPESGPDPESLAEPSTPPLGRPARVEGSRRPGVGRVRTGGGGAGRGGLFVSERSAPGSSGGDDGGGGRRRGQGPRGSRPKNPGPPPGRGGGRCRGPPFGRCPRGRSRSPCDNDTSGSGPRRGRRPRSTSLTVRRGIFVQNRNRIIAVMKSK